MKLGQIIFTGKTKKSRDIIIRYPNDRDAQILLDYINKLSKEQTFIRFQGEQQTLQEEEKYMKDYLEKITKNEAVKLLAFIDEKLVGVSDISLQDKTSAHVGTFGITVAQEYRGEGIGKLLMKLVVEESEKNIKDLRVIALGCFANNKSACAMYTKFGFKEYGKLPGGIKYKGEFVDHVYFYKNIK